MAKQKEMPGGEFFLKLYGLEKDLRHIELEKRFNLGSHEGYFELLAKLKAQNLKKEPFDLSFSALNGLIAFDLYLPYSRCWFADFSKVNLFGSNFSKADFYRANLFESNFTEAKLVGANFDAANLWSAYFVFTKLYGARGLEKALNLYNASFFRVGVTKKERRVIGEKKIDTLFAVKY